ncbi:MAG: 4Fe-4S binding protein [Campylobacterota bacterium]|nr:4Fe-4S binding protein [Campylobacterota bacterium]
MIKLNATKCVRSLSRDSECNKCEVICPTNAIVVGSNPLPIIDISACVGCGACDAVCPNEALSLDDFNLVDFFFDFVQEKNAGFISCRKNVPCIAALSVEYLISIAILKKRVVLDMGHCKSCDIASKCHPQIIRNYEETSYLLEAMESEAEIKLQDVCYEDKREVKKGNRVLKTSREFEKEVKKATDELIRHTLQKADIALLKPKHIPQKRKIFFASLKRVPKPSQYHVVDATEVTFTSQKFIDKESCTACQNCYRACPTGALTSDMKNSKIDFDPFLCIKCNLCHNLCDSDSITLSTSYNIKEFFKPTVQNLISFNVRRCDECNMLFSTNSSDRLCIRCKAK